MCIYACPNMCTALVEKSMGDEKEIQTATHHGSVCTSLTLEVLIGVCLIAFADHA